MYWKDAGMSPPPNSDVEPAGHHGHGIAAQDVSGRQSGSGPWRADYGFDAGNSGSVPESSVVRPADGRRLAEAVTLFMGTAYDRIA
jgi:hypothetical protein